MFLQVLVTAVAVGLFIHYVCGQAGPAAIVIGNGLALSSTAVVLQVLLKSNFIENFFRVLKCSFNFQCLIEERIQCSNDDFEHQYVLFIIPLVFLVI